MEKKTVIELRDNEGVVLGSFFEKNGKILFNPLGSMRDFQRYQLVDIVNEWDTVEDNIKGVEEKAA